MNRYLLRNLEIAAVCVLAPLCLWSHLSPARAQGQAGRAASRRVSSQPVFCDSIHSLAATYANNGLTPPQAFAANSGTLTADGKAVFRIYALSGDPHYYADVTDWFQQRSHNGGRILRVQIKGAPHSRSVAGKLSYNDDQLDPRIVFVPSRAFPVERTAVFTFLYNCGLGQVYQTTFTLTIPAGVGGPAVRG